ncbi:MAG: OmpA family protein [Bacteroidota bacterium]
MKKFQSTVVAALAVVSMLGAGAAPEAQAQGVKPAAGYNGAIWRFGVLGGANYNLLGLGSQVFGTAPNDRAYNNQNTTDGKGLGPYGGILIEFNDGSRLGAHVRATYDSRNGNVDLKQSASGDTVLAEVGMNVSYINIEPALRINVNPNFHVLLGPSLAIKLAAKYDADAGDNGRDQLFVNQSNQDDITGMNATAIGIWGGFGYDFLLNDELGTTRFYLTPFAEASWLFDQRNGTAPATNLATNENIDDQWSTVTFRGGLQFKFGAAPAAPIPMADVKEEVRAMSVNVRAPENIIENRMIEEYFPLRNYVFFEDGSTDMPAKYTRISSGEAASFNEASFMTAVGAGAPNSNIGGETGRSERQMGVYYNGLNIFASRLRANPTATITLSGSGNATEGKAMAESVKNYLVSTFGVDAARITTQAALVGKAGDANTPKEDLALTKVENRRVTISSNNPEIMKPVRITSTQTDVVDNDLVLGVDASSNVDSWRVTIDGNGYRETYGPFRRNSQRIGAAPILGARTSGTYTARFEGTTKDGKVMTKDQTFTLNKKAASAAQTAQRYSILFEFDDNTAISTYESFLKGDVAPKINPNASVYIHGHTDVVGLEDYNLDLSARRANEVKTILESATSGKNVKYETYGFGEARSPFDNGRAEGRYYNRTVIIDVVNR